MLHVKDLRLYLKCCREQSLIDRNDLTTNILINLPRLKTFQFNSCSFIEHSNQVDLLSNEDIRNTFRQFSNQIVSCIDYFPDENQVQCHIYLYPYTLIIYERITNHFPGGLFPYIRSFII